MKTILPRVFGFTLIELLVVIAIIAILATVGITIFSNTQQGARDARRQSDIDSIAQVLEVNKVANTTTYPAMAASLFASNVIPTDTTTAQYSAAWSTTAGATPIPMPTTWAASGAINPTAPNPPWNGSACSGNCGTVGANVPPAGTTVWMICTRLEKTGTIDCISNRQ